MPKLIIHDSRFANWLRETFNMETAADALTRIDAVDILAETIKVDGQEHTIPGECYMTWDEMEDILVDEPSKE